MAKRGEVDGRTWDKGVGSGERARRRPEVVPVDRLDVNYGAVYENEGPGVLYGK